MSTCQIAFGGDFQTNTIEDVINRLERLYFLYLGVKAQQQEQHEETRATIRKAIWDAV